MSRLFHRVKISLVLLASFAFVVLVWNKAGAQTPSPEQVKEGARLYAENCAVCHGDNGEGRVGATLAKDWPSIRPDVTVKNVISNGVPNSPMPAWSDAKGGPFTAEQIDALTVFILSWETGGFPELLDFPTPTPISPITPIPEVEGDPNHGAVLYAENCAMCHGSQGEGRIGATLAKNWPSIRPDLSIKTTVQNGVQGSPMPAWSSNKGGPLSEGDINDIVAYVVALPPIQPAGEGPETPTSAGQSGMPAWMQGAAGIVLFLIALVVIVGAILYFQRRT